MCIVDKENSWLKPRSKYMPCFDFVMRSFGQFEKSISLLSILLEVLEKSSSLN